MTDALLLLSILVLVALAAACATYAILTPAEEDEDLSPLLRWLRAPL